MKVLRNGKTVEKVEPPAVSDAAIADEESRLDALAEAEIEGCDRRGHHAGWTPQPSDYSSAATTPYRAALRESKATIAWLSADRDRIAADHDRIADDRDSLRNDLVEAKRDRYRLSAELEAARDDVRRADQACAMGVHWIAEAREALEPFAKAAAHAEDEPDNKTLFSSSARYEVTLGHLRRARAVLAKLAKGE